MRGVVSVVAKGRNEYPSSNIVGLISGDRAMGINGLLSS